MLPRLKDGRNSRVATLGSVAARNGSITFDDLQAERGYKPMPVYSQSKLACVMFAFELSRRSRATGWGVQSMTAHPGISRTDLLPNGAGQRSLAARTRRFLPFLFQPAWQGALPTLYAASARRIRGIDITLLQPSRTEEEQSDADTPNFSEGPFDALYRISATIVPLREWNVSPIGFRPAARRACRGRSYLANPATKPPSLSPDRVLRLTDG